MKERTFDVDGPVFSLDYEGPAHGPTFVLVHGLGGAHPNWLSLAPLLAERGRVLAPDLPGFGRTPPEGRRSTLGANRVFVSRFITEVAGSHVVLIGNSMGGLIAMMQARREPETVGGLVLIDPALPRRLSEADRVVAGMFATFMVPRVGEAYAQRRARNGGMERFVHRTLALCAHDPSRVPPDVVEALLTLARERAEMPWATGAFLEAARSIVRTLAPRRKVLAAIEDIATPTLMIMGAHDRLVPLSAARSVAQRRPDWDFEIFERCGHIPQMEDAQGVARAVSSWLDGPVARIVGGSRAGESAS